MCSTGWLPDKTYGCCLGEELLLYPLTALLASSRMRSLATLGTSCRARSSMEGNRHADTMRWFVRCTARRWCLGYRQRVKMTSSLYSDGPPLTPPSSSFQHAHLNDTTLTLSSLTNIIHQLSTLLLYTTPPSPHYHAPLPSYTHVQLVAAMSNVLFTSLHLLSPPLSYLPPSPTSSLSSPSIISNNSL